MSDINWTYWATSLTSTSNYCQISLTPVWPQCDWMVPFLLSLVWLGTYDVGANDSRNLLKVRAKMRLRPAAAVDGLLGQIVFDEEKHVTCFCFCFRSRKIVLSKFWTWQRSSFFHLSHVSLSRSMKDSIVIGKLRYKWQVGGQAG